MSALSRFVPAWIRRPVVHILDVVQPRITRTIRGRLTFGFGATVVLVALIGGVAVSALRAGSTGNAQALASVEAEFEGSQRVITAALREIAAGVQYLESGASADRDRWESMMDRAEAARNDAATLKTLTADQRGRLEEVGNLLSAVEVRISLAQAYRRIGEGGQAAPTIREAFNSVDEMDKTLEQFRAGSAARRDATPSCERIFCSRSVIFLVSLDCLVRCASRDTQCGTICPAENRSIRASQHPPPANQPVESTNHGFPPDTWSRTA